MIELPTWIFWVMILGDAVTLANFIAIAWLVIAPPLGMGGTPHA